MAVRVLAGVQSITLKYTIEAQHIIGTWIKSVTLRKVGHGWISHVHGYKEMQESIVPANGDIIIRVIAVVDGLGMVALITAIIMNLMDFIAQVKKISINKICLIECI